ncbi:alpha/beta hydrolase [Candidatus Microgenomates bacterium]|nr:MAG: alpha/beta hydrolase [Candidatus Microgenomates bacterium]
MTRSIDTFTFPDGRAIGFSQYGDVKGKPLFYFHGWPASHISAQAYDAIGKRMHIRIIAPDRPGYGSSDFQKNRTILDWPYDVVALADFLHLSKFAVLGVSGGGPYAAVCAYKIPERITNVGIAVGLSPLFGREALVGMMWLSKIGWQNFDRFPWLRTSSTILQLINVRYGPSLGLHRFLFGAKSDKKMFNDAALRIRVRQTMQEAFRRGYKGPALDLKLYTIDWGFKLSDIQKKVFLWYGAKDQNVSLNMGKFYKKQIPNSQLTIYPNEGHLVSVTHAEEILRKLSV